MTWSHLTSRYTVPAVSGPHSGNHTDAVSCQPAGKAPSVAFGRGRDGAEAQQHSQEGKDLPPFEFQYRHASPRLSCTHLSSSSHLSTTPGCSAAATWLARHRLSSGHTSRPEGDHDPSFLNVNTSCWKPRPQNQPIDLLWKETKPVIQAPPKHISCIHP